MFWYPEEGEACFAFMLWSSLSCRADQLRDERQARTACRRRASSCSYKRFVEVEWVGRGAGRAAAAGVVDVGAGFASAFAPPVLAPGLASGLARRNGRANMCSYQRGDALWGPGCRDERRNLGNVAEQSRVRVKRQNECRIWLNSMSRHG